LGGTLPILRHGPYMGCFRWGTTTLYGRGHTMGRSRWRQVLTLS